MTASQFLRSSTLRSATGAFITALAARVVLLLMAIHFSDYQRHHFHSLGFEALVLSHSLVTGHGFSFPFPQYYPTAWLAPLYVWLLAIAGFLTSDNLMAVHHFGLACNAVFSALTCYPVYFLGKRLFGARVGSAAAWVWALLPVALLMPIAFTWDQSLAALLLALLLWWTYFLVDSSSAWQWSGYGFLWGLAALTNPSLCLVLPFLFLWLWLQRWKAKRPAMRLLACAASCFVLTLFPWTVRNWRELGGFTFVKSNFGIELWLGNNPEVKEVWVDRHNPIVDDAELAKFVSSGELNYNRSKKEEALSFIRSNPPNFVRLSFHRFVDTWTAFYDSKTDLFIKPLGIRGAYIVYAAVFSMLALTGLVIALWKDAVGSLPLAFCVVVFPIPYYITHSSQRYRHPIDPVLTILAVLVLARLFPGSAPAPAPDSGQESLQTTNASGVPDSGH